MDVKIYGVVTCQTLTVDKKFTCIPCIQYYNTTGIGLSTDTGLQYTIFERGCKQAASFNANAIGSH